ncbi:MAG: DUF2490 domain-containing protein [Bacteroidota bacterium]|nr:DUF2490 domain-containing protein [Bacteroidota bacterium]
MKNFLAASVPLQKICSMVVMGLICTLPITAQTSRQVNYQTQTWFSVNTTSQVSYHWAIIADAHIRKNNFLAQSSFEFVRTAIQYNVDKNLSVALGYGHMWLHPSTPGWSTISNEDRIYQQLLLLSEFHKVSILQRFRNEQRWQQKISGDKFTGGHRFTDRFRYLLSFTIPVFKNDKLPAFSLSDEILLQAGKEVMFNPFDQNRFFAGIRQKLTKDLNFDTGYMVVYQQKYSGYQYDLNNTYRLFFYYTPTLYKKHKA